MTRWIPTWFRRWLLRRLQVAEVRSTVVAEPTLIALWQVQAETLHLIELLAYAGHDRATIVEQVTRHLRFKRPDLDAWTLRAALSVWVGVEIAHLGGTPVSVPRRTHAPSSAPRALEVVQDVEDGDATGELPMPSDDPPDAA